MSFFTGSYSQTSNVFKNVQRQSSGSGPKSFTPILINGNKTTKSATLSQSSSSYLNSLSFPDTIAKIEYSKATALPIFIERSSTQKKAFTSNRARCYDFLEGIKGYTKIDNPSKDFFISSENIDKMGQIHIRMFQKFKGIDIYGSDFYVHLKTDKEQFTGNYHLILNQVDTVAKISENRALEIVNLDLQTKTAISVLSDEQKKMLDYYKPEIKQVLKNPENQPDQFKLMYQISIRPNFMQEWIYFIDAIDGTIYEGYDNTKYDGPSTANALDLNGVMRSINTYLENGQYSLINVSEQMFNAIKLDGAITTLDAQNTSASNLKYVAITSSNNTWINKTAVSAHFNTTLVYRYFKNTFNRNSINGNGGSIFSFINIANPDGSSMDNASWNGKFISLGNGDKNFKPLAGALDVIAHEMGHGVVSNTSKLEYKYQSGAINETYADIFGSMVDRANWFIGEDITKTTFSPTGRLRDMSNPHNSGVLGNPWWQPMHTSEMYLGADDFGGVHTNSGIGNYAYFLYATAITKEKAEQVFYKALTDYLVSTSQFIDFRIAVVQAATDIYGATSNEVVKAKEAFDAVGIYENSGNNYSQDYATNPGTLNLCYYDLDPTHSFTFYSSSINGNNPVGLSKNLAKSRISFTDDGTFGVYVASNGTLRGITMSNKNDYVVQSEAIWSNVAISKDGKRLAAVTAVKDTAIYVYDFTSAKWAKFHLYNPTTSSDNQKSGGVLYSDAIEFDITGESLIYDAYNSIPSASGADLHYWDIGFLNVWSNKSNNFGTGDIRKLVGSLPAKINIGNPTFSRNSPYIIAFDYGDENSNTFAICGLNILSGKGDIFATNTSVGYPSYSKDDNVLVFTSSSGSTEVVKGLNILPNKVSPNGAPVVLINKAKWGVCYATGTRVLGLAPIANFSSSYRKVKTPKAVQFFDNSINTPVSWAWTFEGGTPAASTLQNPLVTYSTAGKFKVSLKVTNSYGNNTLQKIDYIEVVQSVLNISTTSLTIEAAANSTKTFNIVTNNGWSAVSNQSWLTFSSATGSNDATITITASANPTINARSATITITGTGVLAQTITVTQTGATPILTVSSNSLTIAASVNSNKTFNITSNISWTLTSNQSWLAVGSGTGTGNIAVTLTATANPTIAARTATVTISGAGITSQSIVVTQEGATPVLTVSSNAFTIQAPANSIKTFDVNSNISWTATCDQNWMTLSSVGGTNNSTITLTTQSNPTSITRIATIKISGVGVTTQTIIVTQDPGTTGISDLKVSENLFYPNPATNILNFNSKIENVLISIFDINGKMVINKEVNDNKIDIGNLQNGVYTIRIADKSGVLNRKFIKK